MKKVILLFGALAIVALAVFNLNLTINSESKVNVSLTSMFSAAQSESGGGCNTKYFEGGEGCMYVFIYDCTDGSAPLCLAGGSVWDTCIREHEFDNVEIFYCN